MILWAYEIKAFVPINQKTEAVLSFEKGNRLITLLVI